MEGPPSFIGSRPAKRGTRQGSPFVIVVFRCLRPATKLLGVDDLRRHSLSTGEDE
jgi:hypothetical protein